MNLRASRYYSINNKDYIYTFDKSILQRILIFENIDLNDILSKRAELRINDTIGLDQAFKELYR